jgi:hypothetical protein
MNFPDLVITNHLSQAVIDYLESRPYREVTPFVRQLLDIMSSPDMIISVNIAQSLIDYLGNLPYKEVAHLIPQLLALKSYTLPPEYSRIVSSDPAGVPPPLPPYGTNPNPKT